MARSRDQRIKDTLIPERIQALRGDDAEELRDKDLMRDGAFL